MGVKLRWIRNAWYVVYNRPGEKRTLRELVKEMPHFRFRRKLLVKKSVFDAEMRKHVNNPHPLVRAIIDRVLFDTEKAELLFSFMEDKEYFVEFMEDKEYLVEPFPWPWRKTKRDKVEVYQGRMIGLFFMVIYFDEPIGPKIFSLSLFKVIDLCETYCDPESEIASRLLGPIKEA